MYHKAINILTKNYEKIQNGCQEGQLSPAIPHKTGVNISEPITQIDFIFGRNVACHIGQ